MKATVFLLTFAGLLLNNMVNVSYTFVKPYFKIQYQVSDYELGLLAACSSFGEILGIIGRYSYFSDRRRLMNYFLGATLFKTLLLSLFPTLSLIGFIHSSNFNAFMFPLKLLTGLTGLCVNITMVSLLHDHFGNEKQGGLLAFWSTSRDIGTALGYIVPSYFIVNLSTRWQIVQILLPALMAILAIIIYLTLPLKIQYSSVVQEQPQRIDLSQFGQFIIDSFKNQQFIIFCAITVTINPIFCCFRDWLPIYLHNWGQQSSTASSGAVFIAFMVIGSFLLGKLYEHNRSIPEEAQCSQLKVYWADLLLTVLISAGMLTICTMRHFSPSLFYVVIAVQGFALGGVLNTLISNETFRLAGGSGRKLDLISTFSGILYTVFVGITNLAISLLLGVLDRKNQNNAYSCVFWLLFSLSILLLTVYVYKGYRTYWFQEEQQVELVPFQQELEHK